MDTCRQAMQSLDNMDTGLSIITDLGSEPKVDCMIKISSLMESFFRDKYYGMINYYWIVCMACKTIPGFEKYTSIKRPMFKEVRKIRELDGTIKDYYGVYSYGIKFDYEEYDLLVSATDEKAERMIAQKVVDSLSNLDHISKKAAAFDKDKFRSDLIQLFKDNHLI